MEIGTEGRKERERLGRTRKYDEEETCWRGEMLCGVGAKKCRYWIDDVESGNCVLRVDREHTLQEIAVALGGITRERARQIEEKALSKMRRMGEVGKLRNMMGGEEEVDIGSIMRSSIGGGRTGGKRV